MACCPCCGVGSPPRSRTDPIGGVAAHARLLIVSPDSRANLARRQAETPLIAPFRFPEPALHAAPAQCIPLGCALRPQRCVSACLGRGYSYVAQLANWIQVRCGQFVPAGTTFKTSHW